MFTAVFRFRFTQSRLCVGAEPRATHCKPGYNTGVADLVKRNWRTKASMDPFQLLAIKRVCTNNNI
ncbi:hypothetical protein J6590_067940 [Homalodisca vitripennis]|nr:hypothetical protein J6590_067940 [Homalodisca vitripennis]